MLFEVWPYYSQKVVRNMSDASGALNWTCCILLYVRKAPTSLFFGIGCSKQTNQLPFMRGKAVSEWNTRWYEMLSGGAALPKNQRLLPHMFRLWINEPFLHLIPLLEAISIRNYPGYLKPPTKILNLLLLRNLDQSALFLRESTCRW